MGLRVGLVDTLVTTCVLFGVAMLQNSALVGLYGAAGDSRDAGATNGAAHGRGLSLSSSRGERMGDTPFRTDSLRIARHALVAVPAAKRGSNDDAFSAPSFAGMMSSDGPRISRIIGRGACDRLTLGGSFVVTISEVDVLRTYLGVKSRVDTCEGAKPRFCDIGAPTRSFAEIDAAGNCGPRIWQHGFKQSSAVFGVNVENKLSHMSESSP